MVHIPLKSITGQLDFGWESPGDYHWQGPCCFVSQGGRMGPHKEDFLEHKKKKNNRERVESEAG